MSFSEPRIDIEILTVAVKPRIGGMTTWFHQIAHGLSGRGWKVRMVAFSDRVEGYDDAPFEMVHIPTSSPFDDRIPLYGKWRRWNRIGKTWKEEALTCPRMRISDGTPGVLDFTGRLSKSSSIPWVVLMGGDVFEETRSVPLSSILHRKIRSSLASADCVIVDGPDLRRSLIGQGISEERIRVHYQGVDINAFRKPSSPTEFYPKRSKNPSFRVVWHGRMAEHHGPERFLNVARQIPESVGRFAGGGDPSVELKRTLAEPPFRGWFLGCLSSQNLIGLLHEADCGIYPLENMAGIPTVLLESMATGLPTVTLRTGACQELIEDGKNGFIIDEVSEMVACANQLRMDPDLRSRVGSSASKTIQEEWSTEATLEKLERTLEEVLGR